MKMFKQREREEINGSESTYKIKDCQRWSTLVNASQQKSNVTETIVDFSSRVYQRDALQIS